MDGDFRLCSLVFTGFGVSPLFFLNEKNMGAVLARCLSIFLRGVRFAAPFLLGVAPMFIAGGSAIYGCFNWVYGFVSSHIAEVDGFFHDTASAISSFGSSFVANSVGQCIAYACATDHLLSVLATVVGVIFGVISFITISIIAGLVGIFVKLIVGKLVQSLSKSISYTSEKGSL